MKSRAVAAVVVVEVVAGGGCGGAGGVQQQTATVSPAPRGFQKNKPEYHNKKSI